VAPRPAFGRGNFSAPNGETMNRFSRFYLSHALGCWSAAFFFAAILRWLLGDGYPMGGTTIVAAGAEG